VGLKLQLRKLYLSLIILKLRLTKIYSFKKIIKIILVMLVDIFTLLND